MDKPADKEERDDLDAFARKSAKDAALLRIAGLVQDTIDTDANNRFLVRKIVGASVSAVLLVVALNLLFPALMPTVFRLLTNLLR